MTALLKAESLATQRYDREKLLALVDAMRSTSFEVLGSTVFSLLLSFPRLVRQAFERLEPCEVKLSRPVLRGLGGSNPARLLDRGWG
jgi:hypothetical protein